MMAFCRLATPKSGFAPLICLIIVFTLWAFQLDAVYAKSTQTTLSNRIGPRDAVLIADPSGSTIFSKNADKLLIPASTLKVLTSLVGFHDLGRDYQFQTEFYLDPDSNLIIKGYGDPLLISEAIEQIAEVLSRKLSLFNDLILDDTYFEHPLTIPGVSASTQPYDSPNGALCVNFNTVNFKKSRSGQYISAEPQTPLLPYVRKKINATGMAKGRIIFSHERDEIIRYAGHMFLYFLDRANIRSNNKIRKGWANQTRDQLIYRHLSPFSMTEVVSKLMEHSNNFTANQILITAGAKRFGPPGTLDKGVQSAKTYASNQLQLNRLDIVEGSGISRRNRMSAKMMHTVLMQFKPYYKLMRYKNGVYYKTGTLHGISTRAGYIEGASGELYPFVVFLNTKGKSAEKMMRRIQKAVAEHEG